MTCRFSVGVRWYDPMPIGPDWLTQIEAIRIVRGRRMFSLSNFDLRRRSRFTTSNYKQSVRFLPKTPQLQHAPK